jgi:hypothetical protein
MSRTRAKAKGRQGGESEPFALLPQSVMQSPALATAPHAAFRVLAILLSGKSRERNGTMMCSDSYAGTFGLSSHDTLYRSLQLLEERGLIVTTRRVQRMRRFAALYGVTWWPLYYRDGQPLTGPEPATHAYTNWSLITPTIGANKSNGKANGAGIPSPRLSGDITPTIGAVSAVHHPDLTPKTAFVHPDYRGNSKNLGPVQRSAAASDPAHTRMLVSRGTRNSDDSSFDARILKLIIAQPHLPDGDIAKIMRADVGRVASIRQSRI